MAKKTTKTTSRKTKTKKKTTTKKTTTTRTVKRKTRKTAKKTATETPEPPTSAKVAETPETSPTISRDSDFGAGILLEDRPFMTRISESPARPVETPPAKAEPKPAEIDKPIAEGEAAPARRTKKRTSRRKSGKTSKETPVAEPVEPKIPAEPEKVAPVIAKEETAAKPEPEEKTLAIEHAPQKSEAPPPSVAKAIAPSGDPNAAPQRTGSRRSRRRRKKSAQAFSTATSSEKAPAQEAPAAPPTPVADILTAGAVCATEPPTQTLDFDAIEAGKPALMEPVVEEVKPRPQHQQAGGRPGGGRPDTRPKAVPVPPPAPESEDRIMLINVADPDECRITLLRDGRLDELYVERATSASNVGNIYKGVVTNVEPAIQAAFVDFGKPSHGFLHITDLHPQYFPNSKGEPELVGRKTPRRHRPPIQACLKRGQEIIVQVIKEGIGTKGPTLSTYISVPGRFLVMMPRMDQLGVSRKIDDDDQRRKLRDMLGQLSLPKDMGFIVRTAGVDRTKRDLQRDLNYLSRLWKKVENRIKKVPAPAEMYRESDLVIRTIRDVFDSNLKEIVVDDRTVAARVRDFLAIASPRGQDIVVDYDEPEPLFHKFGVETEIDKLHSRRVPLPCGGSLIIEQTEALVAIDVNSGRFKVPENAEETAFLVNVEAVDEIARQLRLRDLGGLIICDLIDMGLEKHRRAIEKRFTDALKRHKERAKLLRISRFGILEMTRQRQRPSFAKSMFRECPTCTGSGRVKATDAVTLDVMRQIRIASQRDNVASVDVCLALPVANDLLNRKRQQLADFEKSSGLTIRIEGRSDFTIEQVQISCTDRRGREVAPLPLEESPVATAPRIQKNGHRHSRPKSRGRRGNRPRRPG